jgi:hypothetical protein
MAPLLLSGFGIVFVILRITVHDVDVVPDTIGLALYAAGLWRLAATSRVLIAASTVAGLAAVLALSYFAPDWLSGSGEDARDIAYGVAVPVALALGALGLRPRAHAAEDHGAARQLLVLGWALVIALVVAACGYAVNAADHDRAVGMIGSATVLGLAAMVWFTMLLLLCANRGWARPEPDDADVAASTGIPAPDEPSPR